VFPETAEQRCWWHKIGNVLAALPKSAHPGAKRALAEICNAEDKDHAIAAAKAFNADYGTKWPKAVAKVIDDLDVLLTFLDSRDLLRRIKRDGRHRKEGQRIEPENRTEPLVCLESPR
jgi:transposase-like protein